MVCEQCGCHNTQIVSECYTKKKQVSKLKKYSNTLLTIVTAGIYGLILWIGSVKRKKVCTLQYWLCASCGHKTKNKNKRKSHG